MTSDKVLEDHRNMVIMTGNLSDFQINNMEQWCKIVIDYKYVESVTINYDFTKLNLEEEEELCAGSVSYDFNINKKMYYSKEELEKRLENLIIWTKFMFWEDTIVEIRKKGRKWQSWKK